jgi:hypothetical protein
VWHPWYEASSITSKHQNKIKTKVLINPTRRRPEYFVFIKTINPTAVINIQKAKKKGAGEGLTKW